MVIVIVIGIRIGMMRCDDVMSHAFIYSDSDSDYLKYY